MYSDPKKVKDNRFTFRLNDYQGERLREMVDTTGEQTAAAIRRLLMLGITLHELIIALEEEERKAQKECKMAANYWGDTFRRLICQISSQV